MRKRILAAIFVAALLTVPAAQAQWVKGKSLKPSNAQIELRK